VIENNCKGIILACVQKKAVVTGVKDLARGSIGGEEPSRSGRAEV